MHTHTCHCFCLTHKSLGKYSGRCYYTSEKQRSVIQHLTWLEYLCFNISKRCNPCVLRGPSRLHTTNHRSQRVQRCRSRGHRLTVKYFDSQKSWIRTGVLGAVFLISLRQSVSPLSILIPFPANLIVVSALEVTSCFLLQHTLVCQPQMVTTT